jgi:hypothetical protein
MSYVPRILSARTSLLAAACAVLIALWPSLSRAQDDPPPEAGRISVADGAVSVQPVGLDDWGQAEINMPLGPGDRIFTSTGSRAEIQIGRTYIRMGGVTDVSIIDVSPNGISIGVAQGTIHLHCFGMWPGQALHINTPSGSETLDTPGELGVEVIKESPTALFTEYSNNAFVTGAGGFSSQLPAGSSLELIGSNPVTPQWLEATEPKPVDIWSQQRDQQIMASISYRYVSPDLGGAWELDGAGDWAPQSPYGAIWFPRVAPGWAPYHNGHWVSHAPWGSVWVEQEPWGYTPFHYGRWVVFNGRWGWVPGPPTAHPVWSPALVVFAGGVNVGGVGVSAWFPLGPGEPYRPWYPCSPRYVDQVNITNLRPAPGIVIRASYAGFNFGAVVFANRAVGITAISQADFAAGRPVSRTNVVVINKTVINNITIVERPAVQPNPRVFVQRPPAQPVPVPVERPALINERGMVVSARVGFKPAPPPVRPVPQVQALPGHKVAAPPPGVKMTGARPASPAIAPERPEAAAPSRPQQAPTEAKPAEKPAMGGAKTPNQGGQGPHPNSSRPPELTAKPAPNQPAAAAPKAETGQGAKPGQPANAKPGQNPNQKPGAKPEDKNKKPENGKDHPTNEKPESNNI